MEDDIMHRWGQGNQERARAVYRAVVSDLIEETRRVVFVSDISTRETDLAA